MEQSNSTSSSAGIGFFGLLTIVFIVLKLLKVINWPWWVVLAPAWGSAAIIIIALIIMIFLHFWILKK